MTGGADMLEVGGFIICPRCAHLMICRENGTLGDLNAGEAEDFQQHERFGFVRDIQERICARMIG